MLDKWMIYLKLSAKRKGQCEIVVEGAAHITLKGHYNWGDISHQTKQLALDIAERVSIDPILLFRECLIFLKSTEDHEIRFSNKESNRLTFSHH
jgi:hypothetical protein